MDRRKFLKSVSSAAGLAAAGLPARSVFGQSRTVNRVAVIGAGIVGASIAYHLARRGCEVTVIEKGLPASGASGTTFGWINAAYANQPASYQTLRQHSLDDYHRLAEDLGFPVRWSGSLEWFEDPMSEAQMIREVEAFRRATGAPTTIIDAARATEIEPNLDPGGDFKLAHSTNDGAVDSAATTQALFDRALQNGAAVLMPATVERLRSGRRGIRVVTDLRTVEADLAVVAAGVGTAELARTVDESVDSAEQSTPGIIVTTDPMGMIVNSVLYPPGVHIHQQMDGRVIIGEKAGAPDSETHRLAFRGRPAEFPDSALASQHGRRLLRMARQYVPALSAVRRLNVRIGWRPMPMDGLPVIGHGTTAGKVYFATMHSGVSLAPIVGRLAAEEILDGRRVALLDDFRPQRF